MNGLNDNDNHQHGFGHSNIDCSHGFSAAHNAAPYLGTDGQQEGACVVGTTNFSAGNTANQGSTVGNKDGTAPTNNIQLGAAIGTAVGGHHHCVNTMRSVYGQTGSQYTCFNSVDARNEVQAISAGAGRGGAGSTVPLMAAAQLAGNIRNM